MTKKKVYSVDLDLGYDGLFVEKIFSTRDKAKKYILSKYPHGDYDKVDDKWSLYREGLSIGEIFWDGDLRITEWEVDKNHEEK